VPIGGILRPRRDTRQPFSFGDASQRTHLLDSVCRARDNQKLSTGLRLSCAEQPSSLILQSSNPAPMSALGQKQTLGDVQAMSALPPKAHWLIAPGCPLCAKSGHWTPIRSPRRRGQAATAAR
jgi:hypothetical protein